ncbi:hypothetical protein [Natrinema halophilum]|uniref:hypothetical protein n=1 Tax=Natrinema halophilum TaxID=1699371 RepID=UPI001F1E2351|nr:hypothetical protein [Natrinema halophilum]UHQ96446.1 hypothetical protein HYG82_23690 [Natrinema halophilum]
MSTATDPPMEYQPDDVEEDVLEVIRSEGRVNPLRVREQTDHRKQYVNDAFRQLQKLGIVQKVNRGLYEYVPEEDDLPGAPEIDDHDQRIIEVSAALDDIDAAFERGDPDAARAALERAQEAISDGDTDADH